MNNINMFGIPNCNSIKKSRDWLTANSIDYTFHNYKKDGLDEATLQTWCGLVSWEILLNKRGTTWRKLDDADKQDVDQNKAIALMLNNTSMIKRPVLQVDDGNGRQILVGFDTLAYENHFLSAKQA